MKAIQLVTLCALLAGCAIKSYHSSSVDFAAFLQRSITQEDGPLRVTAAVPDAAETKALTGLDLYSQGIQPVWLKVENRGAVPARATLWSIDRDYYPPIEVAYMNRKQFKSADYDKMQAWFHENGLQRLVPPGESRSGLVFTHLKPGTKGFNLDVFSNRLSHHFTFFVPMPGFTADYTQVDFATLYPADRIRQLDPAGLKTVLQDELACCASDPNGEETGGPLNIALVATPLAVRRSLLRGGWLETQVNSAETQRIRMHHFDGRPQDAIFYLDRKDGDERLGLVLWRAPWNVDGKPGWVGSVFYTVFEKSLLSQVKTGQTIRNSPFLSRLVNESVSADMDGAQRYLLQNFWYNQSLAKLGIVTGVGVATGEQPRVTFDGIAYFTDGNRNIMFLSETPVTLDKIEALYGYDHLKSGTVK